MWRAAGHFDVSVCLATHAMYDCKASFLLHACGVFMFWQAGAGGLAGAGAGEGLTRASCALSDIPVQLISIYCRFSCVVQAL